VTWGNSIKALFWIMSIGALLFLAAGTLDWPGAWIFMAEFVVGGIAVTLWLAWRDPGLLKERMAGPFQKGQVFWDKVFIGFIIVVWFSWLGLMALDAKRWELSHMPDALKVVGAVLIPVGFFIVWLTFRENAAAARIWAWSSCFAAAPWRSLRAHLHRGGYLAQRPSRLRRIYQACSLSACPRRVVKSVLLLALSGHATGADECLLSGVKRT
jgi:hypothetical protein